MKNRKKLKFLLILFFVLSFFVFKYFNLHEFLTLDSLKQNKALLENFYLQNKVLSLSVYFLVYVLSCALSLPGATILTLAGGAIFGFTIGLTVISFASTLGATLAFLSARYLFRSFVETKFSRFIDEIDKGIKKDGAFYLFTLRLIPVFPFFVINLVLGLTKMRVITFYVVSQIGMFLGTMVYVNAGVQLSHIQNVGDILSLKLILSFSAIGIFPIFVKAILNHFKAKKIYKGFKRPKSFDYNMIVIGGGAAGLVTSYICAAVKSKVALIEKEKMGGDCLNTGCVPSKAIIKSAKVIHQMRNASKYGVDDVSPEVDFSKVMERVKEVISKIEPHDSTCRYESLGVDCISGAAKILSPWEVEVNGKVLTTKNITLATGASPIVPEIDGLSKINYLTSNNLWSLRTLPKIFVIIGGGPIGCEMAQAFSRLGSKVFLIERGSYLLSNVDSCASALIEKKFENEGIKIYKNAEILNFDLVDNQKQIILKCDGEVEKISFDDVLFAIGRKANVNGFGLENLEIRLRENQTIEANDYLQTNYPNIYVCGDATGPYQLTHMASHQAWFCSINSLFGSIKKFKVNYKVVPWAVYTDPEVAVVGLTECEAKARKIAYELTSYQIDDLDRAIADSEDYGLVRILTKPGTDKILGATIVGQHASELIMEFVMAIKMGYGLNKILSTIHIYPTMSEANKYVAGHWKKNRTSHKLLSLLEKFHRWNRN